VSLVTKGTMLYFIDTSDDSVVRATEISSITGVTAANSQIDRTNLDSTGREFIAGFAEPGAAAIGVNFDPSNSVHVLMHDMFRLGTTTEFAIGWSDGTAAPTVDSNGTFNFPTTRTFVGFDGNFSNVPFDFALNEIVRAAVTVQISGFPQLHPKA
jgi:hypothetical protein